MKYKKVIALSSIKSDARIERFIRDYDGYGKHLVECKKGFRFETNNSTIEIGNIKELCYEINERLYKTEDEN